MPYWECYYHLIWATHQRASLILPSLEPVLYGALMDKARTLNCEVLAANGTEDHIHLVLSMPTSLSVSELVQQIKGFTSRVVNDQFGADGNFRWQVGYGVLTIGKQRISVACEYVNQQKEHHRLRTTNASLERIEE